MTLVDWQRLRAFALALPGVEDRGTVLAVDGSPFVRQIDDKTLAFAIGDDEDRDALIANAPDVYFITPQFEGLALILAHTHSLSTDEAQTRTRIGWRSCATPALLAEAEARATKIATTGKRAKSTTAIPPLAKPTGPQLHCLLYVTDGSAPERRKFVALGRGTAAEWLIAAWTAHRSGRPWGEHLPPHVRTDLEAAFEHAREKGAKTPARLEDADLDLFRGDLDASLHSISGGSEDDSQAWEFVIFDEDIFAGDASVLPHPDRGDKKKAADDPYRVLIAQHGTRAKPTKSKSRSR